MIATDTADAANGPHYDLSAASDPVIPGLSSLCLDA